MSEVMGEGGEVSDQEFEFGEVASKAKCGLSVAEELSGVRATSRTETAWVKLW